MPAGPFQLTLAVFEYTLLFAGAGLALWLLAGRQPRHRWLGTNALPYWEVSLPEFLLFIALIMGGTFLVQYAVYAATHRWIATLRDRAALEMFVFGAGAQLGMLAGCLGFPWLRRQLYGSYGAEPPPLRRAAPLPALATLRYAAGTVMIALPVLTLLSLGWVPLLRAAGLPDDPQDLVALFREAKSPAAIVFMLLVACGLAPLTEELVFRAGVYRFIRQKLGRWPALLVSSASFGALHANWAGFLPLAALGAILALAYEATGSIRVAVAAHALFNLNTVLLVLAGLGGKP